MSTEYINTQVKAKLEAEYNTTNVAYDNMFFNSKGRESWVRYALLPNSPYYIGGKCYRETGMIAFQVFIPRETDPSIAYIIVDTLGDIFKTKRFNDIKTELPEVVPVGVSSGDGEHWYQVNLFIPYTYDTQ